MRNPFGHAVLLAVASTLDALLCHMPLDVVSGFVTAPGAALTAWTMAAGDSLTVRNAPGAKDIRLLTLWGQNQVAGALRLRSANLSDNVNGIRTQIPVANTSPRLPLGYSEAMVMLDTMIAEQSGSAVGGQIESGSLLMYYDSVPNMGSGWLDVATFNAKKVRMVTVRTVHAPGAGGGYTGQVAINSTDDNAKNGKYYAVLGYNVSAQCCTVGLRGVDTGNLRQAGPGLVSIPHLTEEWFLRLSEEFGKPCIPVINWANKAGVFVDVVQDQAAGAVTVQWFLVEMNM